MKEALNQLSLDSIKFHGPDFDCHINSGSDDLFSIYLGIETYLVHNMQINTIRENDK